jgi:hypothetical protein
LCRTGIAKGGPLLSFPRGPGVAERQGTAADIPDLSKLLLMATDGVVASLYEGVIPGLTTEKIVERRLAREGTCGAYTNCWVATDGTRIAGKLHAYPLDDLAGDPPDPLVPEERYKVLEAFEPAATTSTSSRSFRTTEAAGSAPACWTLPGPRPAPGV